MKSQRKNVEKDELIKDGTNIRIVEIIIMYVQIARARKRFQHPLLTANLQS